MHAGLWTLHSQSSSPSTRHKQAPLGHPREDSTGSQSWVGKPWVPAPGSGPEEGLLSGLRRSRDAGSEMGSLKHGPALGPGCPRLRTEEGGRGQCQGVRPPATRLALLSGHSAAQCLLSSLLVFSRPDPPPGVSTYDLEDSTRP